jgi:glycerol uptake facilitator protein
MTPFIAEIIGTMLMILLGNGVVANVVLTGTKGNNSGWIVINTDGHLPFCWRSRAGP